MEEEYDALLKNKTWHLVSPTSNKNIIDCKWVYRVKNVQMVLLIDTNLILLQKVSNNSMALTMRILLAQLLNQPPFEQC
jgi:hypothetical protein